jgi:hypothetical protein
MVPVGCMMMMIMDVEIIIGMRQRGRLSVVELVVRVQQRMVCHAIAVVVVALQPRARGQHFVDGEKASAFRRVPSLLAWNGGKVLDLPRGH